MLGLKRYDKKRWKVKNNFSDNINKIINWWNAKRMIFQHFLFQ